MLERHKKALEKHYFWHSPRLIIQPSKQQQASHQQSTHQQSTHQQSAHQQSTQRQPHPYLRSLDVNVRNFKRYLRKNEKIQQIIYDYIWDVHDFDSNSTYRIKQNRLFMPLDECENYRKYVGIFQLINRFLQSREDSYKLYAYLCKIVDYNVTKSLQYSPLYDKFLRKYSNYKETKKLPVDCSIKSYKSDESYIEGKEYYFVYKDRKFIGMCDKYKSCYVHGLNPNNRKWRHRCYHRFCVSCNEYFGFGVYHEETNKYFQQTYNNGLYKLVELCEICRGNLYIRNFIYQATNKKIYPDYSDDSDCSER